MKGGCGTREDGFERQKSVETMQEKEERYRGFFDSAGDAFCITDPDGGIIETNEAALSLFGYGRDEMAGMNLRDVCVWPTTYQRFRRELENKGHVKDFRVKIPNHISTWFNQLPWVGV